MVRTTGHRFIYIIVNMFNRYNNTCFLEDRMKNPSVVRRSNPALSSRYILFSLSVMNNVCINYSSTSQRVYFCLENSTPDLFLHEQKYIIRYSHAMGGAIILFGCFSLQITLEETRKIGCDLTLTRLLEVNLQIVYIIARV